MVLAEGLIGGDFYDGILCQWQILTQRHRKSQIASKMTVRRGSSCATSQSLDDLALKRGSHDDDRIFLHIVPIVSYVNSMTCTLYVYNDSFTIPRFRLLFLFLPSLWAFGMSTCTLDRAIPTHAILSKSI